MDISNNTSKQISILINDNKKKLIIDKERKNRAITKEKKWILNDNDYDNIKQLDIIKTNDINDDIYKLMYSEIIKKICNYKNQDLKKRKYNEDEFIDIEYIKKKLIDCELKCYYCREEVMVLYKSVREPKQWSVERLDNNYGHNKNNITIACLSCNISRRTMYHERYKFTKQLKIDKLN